MAHSSGFEHAFIGEIKGGKVSGFHDWVHFYQLERSSNGPSNGINYLGYLDEVDFLEVYLIFQFMKTETSFIGQAV